MLLLEMLLPLGKTGAVKSGAHNPWKALFHDVFKTFWSLQFCVVLHICMKLKEIRTCDFD